MEEGDLLGDFLLVVSGQWSWRGPRELTGCVGELCSCRVWNSLTLLGILCWTIPERLVHLDSRGRKIACVMANPSIKARELRGIIGAWGEAR